MTSRTRRGDPLAVDRLAARYGLESVEPILQELARRLSADPFAPTTIRDPERVLRDHLADSLVALELEEVTRATMVADLGAGAGLPGLCLAIALPAARVSLVESNGKKCGFLTRTVEHLGLTNVEIVNRRVEEWTDGAGRCDLVTARALAAPEVVLEYAAPILAAGGRLVAWRGQDGERIASSTERAADELGLEVERSIRVSPYAGVEHRHLLVAVKRRPTPSGFPRRPGVAVKRPLGRA